ncbi:MAG: hypothetical protein QG675_515 [Patescibacteria group bacterium]|nr:hypothetical protein [Patescibacteria group bacterium]
MREPEFNQPKDHSYKKINRSESQQVASHLAHTDPQHEPKSGIALEKWEQRKEILERARSQSIESIRTAIQDGILPRSISDRIDILSSIPLNFDLDTPMYNGEFRPEEWEIDVSISSSEKYYAATVHLLVHEFIHVLSGTSNIVLDEDIMENRRTGLVARNDYKNKYSYWWLNEAITEILARKVSGEYYTQLIGGEDGAHYQDEIDLLQLLLSKSNQPLDYVLLDAYFEDRSTDTPIPLANEYDVNPQQPAMQAMGKIFNRVFGKGFLNRLDSHLKSYKGVVEMKQVLSSKDFSPDDIRMKTK